MRVIRDAARLQRVRSPTEFGEYKQGDGAAVNGHTVYTDLARIQRGLASMTFLSARGVLFRGLLSATMTVPEIEMIIVA